MEYSVTRYIKAGGHSFSDVKFLISRNEVGDTFFETMLSMPTFTSDRLSVASLVLMPLDTKRTLHVAIEDFVVDITWDGEHVVFQAVRQ